MLEASDQKLFRPSFALSQLPHIPDHVPNGTQISPASTKSIADIETRKYPTAPLQPQHIGDNIPPQKHRRTPIFSRKKKLLIVLLIASLFPSIIIIFELINGVVLYKQAQDGIARLQAIPPLFHGGDNSGPGKYFDQHKLRQAQAELETAHANFVSLSNSLDNNA